MKAQFTEMAAQIEAERDLIDIGFNWDPALSAWLRDAEEAEERVTTLLSQIHSLDLQGPEDRPLQRMCLVIDELMGSGDAEEFERLHRMLHWCSELFSCPGPDAVARRVTQMLQIGLERIDALADLRSAAEAGRDPEQDGRANAPPKTATL